MVDRSRAASGPRSEHQGSGTATAQAGIGVEYSDWLHSHQQMINESRGRQAKVGVMSKRNGHMGQSNQGGLLV